MYNKTKNMNKETLRMQMLAGIITEGEYKAKLNEGTLSRNVNYFSTKTNLKDPNLGTNQIVSSPFTSKKVINNLKPLIIKSGIYQGDPEGMASNAKEFENWLQSNMSRYDIFGNDSLTAREIFDQVYGDYIFEVNELDGEEYSAETDPEFYGEETDPEDPDYINYINIVFNLLKRAGYKLPSTIVDDIKDLYYDFDYIDYFIENNFGADMTLQDAKQTINDLIEENPSHFPEYENYNSVEDFKV
jgi:hypothetical protein